MRNETINENIKISIINYAVVNALKFLVRMVFVRTLSIEYLGINGLFSNILAMLSLAELGIGPAIIYSLYKPLALNDIVRVKGIMRLFKQAYILIGCLILALGLGLYPFLDYFIKDNSIDSLHYFYLVFLLNTAVSYFWSYQRNLLIADQKQFLVNSYQIYVQIFVAVVQMAELMIFKSFWGFIILMLLGTILENYLIARRSYQEYPYLDSNNENIDTNTKKQIIKNTSAMLIHKIAAMLVFSSSNIIVSKFIGLAAVGIYSNYYMVINVVKALSAKIFEAITASVGNIMVLETEEKKIKSFQLIQFANALQASIITVGLYTLFDSFVILWLGEKYLLDRFTVICLVALFYLSYMRNAVLMFRDACGLFWYDRLKAVAEAILNPVISVILVIKYGMCGVVLGGIITTLGLCFWIEPYILFKYGIKVKFKNHLVDYMRFTGCTIMGIILCGYLHRLFYHNSIFLFMLFMFISVFVTLLIWMIAFRDRYEMRYFINLFKKLKIGKVKY